VKYAPLSFSKNFTGRAKERLYVRRVKRRTLMFQAEGRKGKKRPVE
jgi:hypothetical protein